MFLRFYCCFSFFLGRQILLHTNVFAIVDNPNFLSIDFKSPHQFVTCRGCVFRSFPFALAHIMSYEYDHFNVSVELSSGETTVIDVPSIFFR